MSIPGEYDVICGKGKSSFTHQGNKNFRSLVSIYLERYCKVGKKVKKSKLISEIVEAVKSQTPRGRFVRKDPITGHWKEVSGFLAREKVGQAMRDAIKSRDRASKKSTTRPLQEEQNIDTQHSTLPTEASLQVSVEYSDLAKKVKYMKSDEDLYKLFLKRNIEILNSLKNNVIENPQGKKCEALTMIHANIP